MSSYNTQGTFFNGNDVFRSIPCSVWSFRNATGAECVEQGEFETYLVVKALTKRLALSAIDRFGAMSGPIVSGESSMVSGPVVGWLRGRALLYLFDGWMCLRLQSLSEEGRYRHI